jgi:hypothetical protein
MLYTLEAVMSYFSARVSGGIRLSSKNGNIEEYIFGYKRKMNGVSTITKKNGKLYFCFQKKIN